MVWPGKKSRFCTMLASEGSVVRKSVFVQGWQARVTWVMWPSKKSRFYIRLASEGSVGGVAG